MPTSTPNVDAAFTQLLAALDAESAEYQELGGQVFHGGAPRQAQGLLRRGHANTDFRNEVAALYEKWKAGLPMPPFAPAPRQPRAEPLSDAGPGLIRNIDGVSESEAAHAIGVKPAKVREWLEAGALKGYRRVSGRWKIARTDLLDFIRNRRY